MCSGMPLAQGRIRSGKPSGTWSGDTTFLDRRGIIRHKHIGEISMETLTQEIEKLLSSA
ncbi:MAG: hypothetical protein HY347_05415 [candidate division NC10 bacterium]|nr:hypothetical protein [candidate division NC10 bacterium]